MPPTSAKVFAGTTLRSWPSNQPVSVVARTGSLVKLAANTHDELNNSKRHLQNYRRTVSRAPSMHYFSFNSYKLWQTRMVKNLSLLLADFKAVINRLAFYPFSSWTTKPPFACALVKPFTDRLFTEYEVNVIRKQLCVLRRTIRLRHMLLPKLERGDESDDGGMETSPRFTRGGFSTRIKATGVKDGEIANLKDEDKVDQLMLAR
ncbi:unnamed protein product [Brassica oleracea]